MAALFMGGALPVGAAPGTAEPAAAREAERFAALTKTQGAARIERLGPIYVDGAGELVNARAGDWRLSNELASFTFASVDNELTTMSYPVGGARKIWFEANRHPGALIDVAVAGDALDPLAYFTQGLGGQMNDPLVEYDTAEPVEREGEVGLRLLGLPFPNALVQLETVYWLAPGRPYLTIESRLLGTPPPGAAPVFADAADWGWGQVLVPNRGFLFTSSPLDFSGAVVMTRATDRVLGLTLEQGLLQGRIQGSPSKSRTLWTAATDAPTSETGCVLAQAQQVADAPTSASAERVYRRQLWVASGSYQKLVETVMQHRGLAQGSIHGQLMANKTDKVAEIGSIHILQGGRDGTELFSVAESDAQGRYAINLPPGRYFLKPVSKSIVRPLGTLTSFDIESGQVQERDLGARADSAVTVRVVDDATSKPLAARLKFESFNPQDGTPFLGFPQSAAGYFNQAYVGREGGRVVLPAGHFIVKAYHGIEYDRGEQDFRLDESKTTEVLVRLRKTNPTAGWASLEVGARTLATPGVTVTPKDLVLMAQAEGIDVLISGDFEVVTDLGPTARKLGVAETLRTARGFRTAVPAHPDWGQLLVYPVSKDAPAPADVRKDWAQAKTRGEVIKALRRHYPGALIQADLPYTEAGQGFLGFNRHDPLLGAFERFEGEDLSLDAINVFPARQNWKPLWQTTFWINHWLRGRRYLASTSAAGRTVNGSEPGFPRLLVRIEGGSGLPSEATWVEALRERRVQVTTGPFVQFEVGGQGLGGLVALKSETPYRLRVTAPTWAQPSSVSIDKEVRMQTKNLIAPQPNQTQFAPDPQTGEEWQQGTLADLKMMSFKDTLLGVRVDGQINLSAEVRGGYFDDALVPFAFTHPIVVDANKNGIWDPLVEYLNRGR